MTEAFPSPEEFKKMYDIGQSILTKLFKMTDSEIKEFLKSVINSFDTSHQIVPVCMFEDTSELKRTIKNEKPDSIEISSYDSIVVNSFGLVFREEHSYDSKLFVQFKEDNIVTIGILSKLGVK